MKHRGRGIASINYPIGMNLGGDPSQALVHSNPSGKFTVALSAISANALRSLLTMLGIVIGVAAVIAMVAIGSGARNLTASNPAWDAGPVFSADGRTLYYRAMKRPGFEADRFALMAMDLPVDSVHTSDGWGVSKPAPGFFAKVAAVAGREPREILYVGDRLDNDVLPAAEAGMRTALLRRGPWGYLHAARPEAREAADVIVDDLHGLLPALRGLS